MRGRFIFVTDVETAAVSVTSAFISTIEEISSIVTLNMSCLDPFSVRGPFEGWIQGCSSPPWSWGVVLRCSWAGEEFPRV